MHRFKSFLINLFLLLFVLGLCEGIARLLFATKFPQLEKVRLMARGEVPPNPTFQTVIGQAHLTYIPAPRYTNRKGVQHNAQGYRGKAVSMRKVPGVLRILFLGGSTVYGWGVERWEDSYPVQVEELLNKNLPPGIQKIEIINGGLPYGTVGEMLTHYHFKYHYYQPDLVILEAGGNDSESLAWPFYHPDYSHWRQPLELPQRPARLTQSLMRSRLFSLVMIPMFYGLHPYQNNLQRNKPASKPLAEWYQPVKEKPNPPFNIPEDEMAMSHDLKSLIREISEDGAKILLVPFRPKPGYVYAALHLNEAMALNEKIMKKIAQTSGLLMAPFPGEIISPNNWTDDCHLNVEGEKEKARHIAPYIQKLFPTPLKNNV